MSIKFPRIGIVPRLLVVCAILLLLPSLSPHAAFAQGVLLLSDSFNRTVGDPLNTPPQLSSWGDNDNASGGTITQTYEASDPFTDAGNTGGAWVDGDRGVLAYAFTQIEHDWATDSNVLAGGGLKIEFDLQEGGVASGHYAWWLGTADATIDPGFFDAGGTVPLLNNTADVGLLWRNAGGSGGSFLAGQAVNNFFPIDPPLTLNDPNAIRIEIATANFNPGTPATLSLFIDGTATDINGAAAGNDLSFNWDGEGAGYMGFSKNIAVGGGGIDNLRISTLQDVALVDADFNNNGVIGCDDVDPLVNAIVNTPSDLTYDLVPDGVVNHDDLVQWLADAGQANLASQNPYLEGDATLDGTVDGQDFIEWNSNKFSNLPAWCSGDFTADGVVDGQDFIIWNSNKFTSADASVVPEPTSFGILAIGVLCWMSGRRKTM